MTDTWNTGIALLHLNLHVGWGGVGGPKGKVPITCHELPIVQEAGWAPGPVWMDVENLTPHRDSIPGLSSQ